MGGVYWMRGGTSLIAIAGILGIIYVMIAWWRDVIIEAQTGYHTRVVQLHLRYGMILFIASEVMFFVAWFWAYFDTALLAGEHANYDRYQLLGGHWPPVPTADARFKSTFDPWHLPLLEHADPADLGHHGDLGAPRAAGERPQGVDPGALDHGDPRHHFHLRAGLRIFARHLHLRRPHLRLDLLHGDRLPRRARDHRHDFLIVCLIRAYAGHFKPDQHFGFEAAAWYWHFVDVVWLFLFTFIYVWGAGRRWYARPSRSI